MIKLTINGQTHSVDVDPNTPLLWVLRENLQLTGTKFGCGLGQCGACTVHRQGSAIRACVTPVGALNGESLTTIEGLAGDDGELHPLQAAWIAEQTPQCGYCQSGQIMAAAALLARNPKPDDQAIDVAMSGNLCRCGMYSRIRRSIKRAASDVAMVGVFDPKAFQSSMQVPADNPATAVTGITELPRSIADSEAEDHV